MRKQAHTAIAEVAAARARALMHEQERTRYVFEYKHIRVCIHVKAQEHVRVRVRTLKLFFNLDILYGGVEQTNERGMTSKKNGTFFS